MATYTSTQAGNWNTDATWGGAGHPTANDDVVNIGHSVTYDAGTSAVTWGVITINNSGILILPTAANSNIEFNATAGIIVMSGGELRAGTSVTPVGASYACKFIWPQGAASRSAIDIRSGGKTSIYGDSAYYGSVKHAELDAAWSSGQLFYVKGNVNGKWAIGQKLWIHKGAIYSSYLTDAGTYTIATVGAYDSENDKTAITISEAAPAVTFAADARVVMLSRNIEIYDKDSSWDFAAFNTYTHYLHLHSQDTTFAADYGNVLLNDCIVRGFYSGFGRTADDSACATVDNFVVYNCYKGLNKCWMMQGALDIISCETGIESGGRRSFSGCIIAGCNDGYEGYEDFLYDIEFLGCYDSHLVDRAYAKKIYFKGNRYCVTYAEPAIIYDLRAEYNYRVFSGQVNTTIIGGFFANNTNFISSTSTGRMESLVLEDCDVDGDLKPYRLYSNAGDFLPLDSGDGHWQTPPSANDWILEATPSVRCHATWKLNQLILGCWRDIGAYAVVGSRTLTFKIYPVGWSASLDQDNILLRAHYLDSTGTTRSEAVTAVGTFANAGWRDLTVSFTAGRTGIVYFNLEITKYEAGCYVLIDPVWSIT